MRCPFCSHAETQVKDSRPTEDSASIRRRRQCEACGARFTTFERIQLRELTVLKTEGRRETFDREKLERSIAIACRKRPVESNKIDRLATGIQRQLETMGEPEVASSRIGELVMEGLKGIDTVAYVRFASVYKDFSDPADFEAFVAAARDAADPHHPRLPID